jgi:prevent-host-death family protein
MAHRKVPVVSRRATRPGNRRSATRHFTSRTARSISATDAARTFSDLLNRVQYRGETVIVERGGTPICEIIPAKPLSFTLAELGSLLNTVPKPDPGFWDDLEEITRNQPHAGASPWER